MENKIVFITGASKGIGKTISEHLLSKGYKLALGYNTTPIKLSKNNSNCIAIKLDISKKHSIKQAIKTCTDYFDSGIDILINNAAISQEKPFEKISDSDWNNMITTNLKSAFDLSQEVIPVMKSKKWGRIINIASIGGQWGGYNQVHYAISKAGIINLTKSLSKLYSKYGINSNSISPGLVYTDMIKNELKSKLGQEKIKNIPIGRIAEPMEIATVVEFLCSNNSSYITGQTINVNGGMYSD